MDLSLLFAGEGFFVWVSAVGVNRILTSPAQPASLNRYVEQL